MKKVFVYISLLILSVMGVNAQFSIEEVVTTNITCFGGNDGSVTISVSGGTSPYYYYIQKGGDIYSSPATLDTVYTFLNIKANNWIVLVEDSNSATDYSNGLVGQPSAINITSEIITPITCSGFGDGELKVTATGESGNYIFTLNPGGSTNITGHFTGLGPGNYTIHVADAGGCSSSDLSNILPLSNPGLLSIGMESATDIACAGAANGIVSAVASGGTGSYSYSLNPGAVQTNSSGIFNGLDAGIYTVEVTDINGCPSAESNPVTVNEPLPLLINSEIVTNATCFGSNNGTVSVTATGGNTPYIFTISPGGGTNATGSFTNLSPGNYTISLNDSKSCGPVISNILTVTQPAAITVNSLTSTDITCNNANNGTVSISAVGGNAPLSYTILPGGASNMTGNFTGISQGIYTVEINDAAGCTPLMSNPVTVNNPPVINIISESSVNITCNGAANGSIHVSAAGGTGILQYTLLPVGTVNTTGVFNSLAPGLYTVNVTDENACPGDLSSPFNITEPAPILITVQNSTDITCFGAADGSVNITATGGTAPRTYTLNPGGVSNATGIFNGLSGATYTVTVSDASGCPSVVSNPLTVNEPAVISILTAVSTDLTCNDANNGTINVNGTGGTGTLTYTLNPGAVSNTSGTFNNLPGNTYTVSVSDDNSCPPAVTALLTVNNPPEITILTQTKKDISCNGDGNGEIAVTASGGTGTLQYTLSPGAITNTSGTFTGLNAGIYTVSVTDINGCPAVVTGNINIVEPGALNAIVLGSSNLSLNCNGDNNGSININVIGGTGPFTFHWTGPNGYTSALEDLASLVKGIYNLEITDAGGCSTDFPALAEVTEPPVLTILLSKTDVVCNGMANGTITVTAGGGTPPYQYSKNGITYQPANTFNGLIKNTYRIYIRDAGSCITSDTLSIMEPEELQVSSEIRIDNNKCFGDALGEIRILEVSGGVEPFNYSINGGVDYSLSPNFIALSAGSYQTVVEDASGCIAFGNLNVINQPSRIRITNYAQVDVTDCFGAANGQIAVEATGGTGTKTYRLDGGPSNVTGLFFSVGGGSHVLRITDINSCTKDTTINIAEPLEITFTSLNIVNVTGCPGSLNGEISGSAAGGAGGILYALNGGAYQASGDFAGLVAGQYTFSAMDLNSCKKDTIINITEPTPISIANETVVNVSCGSTDNGSITVTATGGISPYTFTLNPLGISNATGIFTGLTAATYTVDVTDSNGCGPVISSDLEILETEAVAVDSISSAGILCSGANNAQIQIYASGGAIPYQYSIDDEVTYYGFKDFTGLTPGTYYLSVKDANNCKIYSDTIVFSEPDPLVVVIEASTDVTGCFGDQSGSVNYQLSGGTGIIGYSIDNGTNWVLSGNFTNLPAGDYTVNARDENGCSRTSQMFVIDQPSEITAGFVTTPHLDEFNKGSISIENPTGGTGNLVFSIYGDAGPFTSETLYTELDENTYQVIIKDENDCEFERLVDVPGVDPLEVTITSENISCFGSNDGSILLTAENPNGNVEYSIDNGASWHAANEFMDLTPGDFDIVVRDEAGRYFSDIITISEPVKMSIYANITPATCSSLSVDGSVTITVNGAQGDAVYSWSNGVTTKDLVNVDVGTYLLDVFDEKGCYASTSIVIPALTSVAANAGTDTSICAGDQIMLNGQGGTTISWLPVEGLSDPTSPNPIATIENDIEYILRVEGMFDCFDIDTVRITVFPYTEISAGSDTSIFINDELIISTTGGPFESYSWEPVTGIDDPLSGNVVIQALQTTMYIVNAIDENGCLASDTILISIAEKLKIYNVFSPNGDGVNDYWEIDEAEFYPNMSVEVFNRWGERLFGTVGYSDDKRWDGTFRGKDVPIGTYYYVVIPTKGANAINGPVTIVR